jgi:tetratricopeptide (TPR) repeat protein
VQSVAWVSERKDVLSTMFWLLTMWAYWRYVEKQKQNAAGENRQYLFYLASLGFFVLGLLSKPMVVTLPFVLLLLDVWPLQRFSIFDFQFPILKRLVLEKIPFFALSVIASVVTCLAQKSGGAMTAIEKLSLLARMENAVVAYVRYLGKFFWPENLAILYPYPRSWPLWMVFGAALILIGLSVLTVWWRKSRTYLLVGWLWFIGTLVPVIGLVQVGEQSIADRYMYVPMIGLLIALVWGLHELAGLQRWQMNALPALAVISVICCLSVTHTQIGYWKDSETLFRHEIAVVGGSRTAHYKLGVALNEKGNTTEASYHFQEILKEDPNNTSALFALGIIANNQGQSASAIPLFEAVIKQKPDYAEAHGNLGIALGRSGQLEKAIDEYREAIRLNPNYAEARISLGVALARTGQLDDAISQFQTALKQIPDNFSALYNLGLALSGKGQLDESAAAFQHALALKPDNADAHNNLGLVFSRQGHRDDAIRQFQEALRLNPNHLKARYNLDAAIKSPETAPETAPRP